MLPALPTGMQCTSGASPSTSTISNAAVFWPSMRTGFTEFTTSTPGRSPSSRTMSSASSNVPAHRHDPGAVDQRLRELAERDLPRRQHDRAQEPGARRVRGRRRRRVARRRADDRLGAVLDRLRHGHRHAAVLERTGRVRALDLQEHPRDPGPRRDARRLDERRVALEQRDDRRRVGDRQVLAVRLDQPGPAPGRRPRQSSSPMTRTTEPTRCTASTSGKRLERGPEVGLAGAVRDEHEPGVGADAALLHRLDRHAVAAELPRDRREHAGTVGHLHQAGRRATRPRRSAGSACGRARRSWRPGPRTRGSSPRRRGRRARPTRSGCRRRRGRRA